MAEGIRRALAGVDDLAIVDVVTTAQAAIASAESLRPAVTLVGSQITGMPLVTCVRRIRETSSSRVGVVADRVDADLMRSTFAAGANGFIVATIDPRDLPSAIRQIVETTMFNSVDPHSDAAAHPPELTRRELAILQLLAQGLANSSIGARLEIGERAVKFHLNNIYRKLGVPNRTSAVRKALAAGIVSPHFDEPAQTEP